MDMKAPREYINEIVSKLAELDPYKIILFGSQATGTYSEDSDLDLLIILDSKEISKTYDEKMHNKLLVRDRIIDISKHIPIDLIVYTKAEYDIIEKARTSFIKEINNTGKVLYEKAS